MRIHGSGCLFSKEHPDVTHNFEVVYCTVASHHKQQQKLKFVALIDPEKNFLLEAGCGIFSVSAENKQLFHWFCCQNKKINMIKTHLGLCSTHNHAVVHLLFGMEPSHPNCSFVGFIYCIDVMFLSVVWDFRTTSVPNHLHHFHHQNIERFVAEIRGNKKTHGCFQK